MVVYEESPSETKIKEGYIFTYLDDGKGLRESVRALESTGNINLSNFNFSNSPTGVIPGSGTAKTIFTPHSSYATRVLFTKYSAGRLLEQQKTNDIVDSYIWGYNDQYPIAHVVNASNNSIAFTSFEENSFGNWSVSGGDENTSVAFTGTKSYSLSTATTLSKASLPQANYVVSYWSKNGSLLVNGTSVSGTIVKDGWTYFEHTLSSSTSISVTANNIVVVDELRLYPVGAQMTTYVYKMLVGVASITDANNKTINYQYDTNGRLVTIRDSDGKVVEQLKYHYKGQ
jgi:YD repeat-containing protein